MSKYTEEEIRIREELVNQLLPRHGRTSCSDEKTNNGIDFDGQFRCARCALLEIARGESEVPFPEDRMYYWTWCER